MPRNIFHDLATVVDDVHARLDAWAADGTLAASLDLDSVEVLRLAIHEWIANLVQHAAFPAGVEIVLEVTPEAGRVQCTMEDSSTGFDFAAQVERQQALLEAPAPSERGRGLLMLVTCTEDLAFRPAAPGARQTIAFRVRADAVRPRLAGLFRPDDLAAPFPSPLPPVPGAAFATRSR